MEHSAINKDINLQKNGIKAAISKPSAFALVLISSLIGLPLLAADASDKTKASAPESAAQTKTVSAKETKSAPTAETNPAPLASAKKVSTAASKAASPQENALVQQIIGMCGKVSPQTALDVKNTPQGVTFTISSASKEDISLIYNKY